MFKIFPVQDNDTARKYLTRCGAMERSGAFVYAMIDMESKALMGLSQFEILGERGIIFNILGIEGIADDEAMFILGRQTMNFIDMCGAHICYADEAGADIKLLKKIGFKYENGEYICNMKGMFDGNCSH